ncbi:MAG: hypothetical protein R8M11_07045 [Gallionella sp.]
MRIAESSAVSRAACGMALLLFSLILTGCATYSDSFGAIKRNLAKQEYDAALIEIEKQAESKNSRALYLLNKGMVLRMKQDFSGSNDMLEAAKLEMERLYAVSVSENALSFIVNDATVSYAGEDYEQVLVHLYMALNYLELGQLGEARVEALQVDLKLREISEDIPDNKFSEDALSRYITGLIYEELGEWSDAMIAYRKSYEAFQNYQDNYGVAIPDMLKHDLLKLGTHLGLNNEVAQYREEFGIESDVAAIVSEQEGELVFILNNGLAPIKREKVIAATGPSTVIAVTATDHKRVKAVTPVVVNIALPYYESHPNNVHSARVSVSGLSVDTQMMEDIDAIAKASLDARMAAITARSIARAVSKVAIQNSVDRVGQNSGSDPAAELLGSLFVRVAAIATERADTRSWLTLPANVQLARMALKPGSYDLKVELLGANERVVETIEYKDVVVSKKRKTYLTYHWIPN